MITFLKKKKALQYFRLDRRKTSTLSFADLAQQTSSFPKTSEGTWKGFPSNGGQLFSSNDDDNPEREVEGTDFKPIVSLPDIAEQKLERKMRLLFTLIVLNYFDMTWIQNNGKNVVLEISKFYFIMKQNDVE